MILFAFVPLKFYELDQQTSEKMKSYVLIFSFFIVLNIANGVRIIRNHEQIDANLNDRTRWMKELSEAFMHFLFKVNNTDIITVKISNKAPTEPNFNPVDVKFQLYTRRNRYVPDTLAVNDIDALKKSHFDKQERTVFVTHGWMNYGQSESCVIVRDAYLRFYNMNVIIIDWSSAAFNLVYPQAAVAVPKVGSAVALFMEWLSGNGYLTVSDTVLIGDSLGAHVVGIAGNKVTGLPKAIYGLDPALPLFKFAAPRYRISNQDAAHVQIIHTNAGNLGTNQFWGHVSFVVSGGTNQPGCFDSYFCPHSRAHIYYAESIDEDESGGGFYGHPCNIDGEDSLDFYCDEQVVYARMGGYIPDPTLRNGQILVVSVHDKAPFGFGIPFSLIKLNDSQALLSEANSVQIMRNHEQIDANLNDRTRWMKELSECNMKFVFQVNDTDIINVTIGNLAPIELNVNPANVKFLLYTRRNRYIPDILTVNDIEALKNSHFDKQERTIFIAHGWLNYGGCETCVLVRNAYLRSYNMNVIIIDWSFIALVTLYSRVAATIPKVGSAVALFMEWLSGNGYLTVKDAVLIGDSLGAHVVGIAGNKVTGLPRAIYGLDPALPLFKFAAPRYRISDQDAEHVQLINTNAGILGTNQFWGHVSFVVSGGMNQPGCWEPILCPHSRAHIYYAESIDADESHGFYGHPCKNDEEEESYSSCGGPEYARMDGYIPDLSLRKGEVFVVSVRDKAPFGFGIPLSVIPLNSKRL